MTASILISHNLLIEYFFNKESRPPQSLSLKIKRKELLILSILLLSFWILLSLANKVTEQLRIEKLIRLLFLRKLLSKINYKIIIISRSRVNTRW